STISSLGTPASIKSLTTPSSVSSLLPVYNGLPYGLKTWACKMCETLFIFLPCLPCLINTQL
ncbi:MAG: hypothetical protein QNJ51_25565, partial [Calothrix sp. MO_167.B12]|nr:hypothetical protein [Calothrix sp. MO_167.B12]